MHRGFYHTTSSQSLSLGVLLLTLSLFSTSFADPVRFSPERIILVGVNKDFAPLEFENSEGKPDGYTVDLMKAIARQEGLNIKFVFETWSNTRRDLQDKKIDMVTGMLYSKERDKMFDFSLPNSVIAYTLFIRKETPIKTLNDLKEKEIIVVEDVYAHDWLIKSRITSSIISVKDPIEALQLLASGKHDCIIMPRLHGLDLLDKLKITNVETTGPPILAREFCFAVAEGNSDLLAELNEGLFALQQSGEYDEIYRKWMSVYTSTRQFQTIIKYGVFAFALVFFLLLTAVLCNLWLKRIVRRKTKEIHQNHERLSQILEGIPIPTYVIDENRRVTHWNKACEFLTGESADKIVGTNNYTKALRCQRTYSIVDLLLDNVLKRRVQQYETVTYRESSVLSGAYEAEIYCPDLGIDGKWLYGAAVLLKDETGKITGAIESWQDLTESKQLEKQLIQSQKMEAIGTLASGVAHDFNNILLALMGHAELARMQVPKESNLNESLEQILSAGMRGKHIVRQILTFTRQADNIAEPVQVRAIVEETLQLIDSSLPLNINVQQDLQSDALALADATHIHQIVMNLCTNASQAMVDAGGVLGVQLSEVVIDEDQPALSGELIPGKYIKLTVSDTGHGIPADIRDKIFDPFFTTKEKGEGTGMGLSVTLGIVKQYGGTVKFTSETGNGSTFQVYLPISLSH